MDVKPVGRREEVEKRVGDDVPKRGGQEEMRVGELIEGFGRLDVSVKDAQGSHRPKRDLTAQSGVVPSTVEVPTHCPASQACSWNHRCRQVIVFGKLSKRSYTSQR
jgi:hypothetical protein